MNQNATGQTALGDKERMEDLLTQEKYLMDAYASFIPEASCEDLRQVLGDNFNGCAQSQYEVFQRMSQMGWYPVKDAPAQEVDAAKQKYRQMQSEL